MGAAAFLMAEFARIPYVTIMQYAIFPAILFFPGIFVTVDLEAKKLRLKGLASDELPDWRSQVPNYPCRSAASAYERRCRPHSPAGSVPLRLCCQFKWEGRHCPHSSP